jgi:NAD(P)-dependent dehydrogenase (short-subunit alcohol dehydrogenase family)
MEEMGMTTLPLDVTSAESIAACKDQVVCLTGGTLDILVNNAYVLPPFSAQFPATPVSTLPSLPAILTDHTQRSHAYHPRY